MFQLDTRYSAPLQALYTGVSGRLPLVMGSYGLGVSRILAASLEVLSLSDQLRWPAVLAPFTLVIVTPKVRTTLWISRFRIVFICLELFLIYFRLWKVS